MNDTLLIWHSDAAPKRFGFVLKNDASRTGHYVLDGPPFWMPHWHRKLLIQHTAGHVPGGKKCVQSELIKKVGRHPLCKPVKDWIEQTTGGKWLDAINCVSHYHDDWCYVRNGRYVRLCDEVHLDFESTEIALMFKLAWC